MSSASIWVRTRFVGFHRWPRAHAERSYLADRHRHIFQVEVEVGVGGMDRVMEFHDLEAEVDRIIAQAWPALGSERELGEMSCEMVANRIAEELRVVPCVVSVSEGGECGARVRRGLEA